MPVGIGSAEPKGMDLGRILALALQRMVASHRIPDGRVTLRAEDARTFVESTVADAAAEALAKSMEVRASGMYREAPP